jgi:Uncharacterized protein conserved in bacteria
MHKMESAGFKEWAIVCQALGRGEQSVILRKGGIAEGREGFSFRHKEFFLFPTYFHEQVEKVRKIDIEFPAPATDTIEINFFAKIELSCVIKSWKIAQALEPFHILRPEVVRERFDYDRAPGLHIAFVRGFRIEPSWIFPNAKSYGGCRSWVKLPEPPPALRFEPVLGDREHERRRKMLVDLVGSEQSATAKL